MSPNWGRHKSNIIPDICVAIQFSCEHQDYHLALYIHKFLSLECQMNVNTSVSKRVYNLTGIVHLAMPQQFLIPQLDEDDHSLPARRRTPSLR
jgi:hypothetical protein